MTSGKSKNGEFYRKQNSGWCVFTNNPSSTSTDYLQKGSGAVSRRRGEDSAGQGILRFYEEDSPGFQIGPTTVLACSLIFIGLVVVLHIVGKFSS